MRLGFVGIRVDSHSQDQKIPNGTNSATEPQLVVYPEVNRVNSLKDRGLP